MFKVSWILDFLLGPKFYFGGGGGGGGQSNETYSQTSNIPDYAQPYVEQMLGAAQKEIFNYGGIPARYTTQPVYSNTGGGGQNWGGMGGGQGSGSGSQQQTGTRQVLVPGTGTYGPTSIKAYKPFSNDPNAYFAGFSPMQQQAQQSAQNLQAGPQGFQQDIGAYMSPYAELALQPQLQAAARQSAIQGQQQQAQATQGGAFGGGRDAIMRAERERSLGDTQSNIMATGMQNAFNAAQNQYNTGFEQQTGLIGLQNQLGAQQQAQEQQKINQQIQDYATAQQYPMMQLANMSALTRGLPLESTTAQMYRPAPSMTSQLAGIGTAYAGLTRMGQEAGKAKGGAVKEKKRPAGLVELALMKMR